MKGVRFLTRLARAWTAVAVVILGGIITITPASGDDTAHADSRRCSAAVQVEDWITASVYCQSAAEDYANLAGDTNGEQHDFNLLLEAGQFDQMHKAAFGRHDHAAALRFVHKAGALYREVKLHGATQRTRGFADEGLDVLIRDTKADVKNLSTGS